VLKMINVDLERDVNLLQDALTEAKHLIQLRHKHIVGIEDVFIHRCGCTVMS
jgi:serine/threonine protein kinase